MQQYRKLLISIPTTLYQASTIFFNSLPTLKNGNLFGFTSTAFPVLGFLPYRWSGFLGQGTGIHKWEVALG
jgi:hypothetical protein